MHVRCEGGLMGLKVERLMVWKRFQGFQRRGAVERFNRLIVEATPKSVKTPKSSR